VKSDPTSVLSIKPPFHPVFEKKIAILLTEVPITYTLCYYYDAFTKGISHFKNALHSRSNIDDRYKKK